MDRSNIKRSGTKNPSQLKQKALGNSDFLPRVGSARPAMDITMSRKMPRGNSALPILRPITNVVEAPNETTTIAVPKLPVTQTNRVQKTPNLDMKLPGTVSPSNVDRLKRFKLRRSSRRLIVKGTALMMVLVLTLGGLLFSQGYLKLHKVFQGDAPTAAALQANVSPSLLKGEGSGRINVLLLGRGGGSHDGADLTDSMMLASIDPVNHKATLISIPRDLWVNVPNHGDMKINAAWETGEFTYEGKEVTGSTNPKAIDSGFNMVDQTVEGVLGVSIDYNVLVDFQAFQQAVDTVGGVTVNVPTDLVDPTMAWLNGGNSVLAKAGQDSFNGEQALTYVRSRETTSDFARAQRQRDVLIALKSKIDTLGTLSNPLKISGLMSAFGNNVNTDLSLKDASRLYSIMKGIKGTNISSTSLDNTTDPLVTTGDMDGQSIVLPGTGLFDYSAIQLYVRQQLKDPYIIKENAKIEVLNGTSTTGLASTVANELSTYGYDVVNTGNANSTSWASTEIVQLNSKDKYTNNYLEQRFNTKAVTHMPNNSIPTNGADFVIILGSDEANSTQP